MRILVFFLPKKSSFLFLLLFHLKIFELTANPINM